MLDFNLSAGAVTFYPASMCNHRTARFIFVPLTHGMSCEKSTKYSNSLSFYVGISSPVVALLLRPKKPFGHDIDTCFESLTRCNHRMNAEKSVTYSVYLVSLVDKWYLFSVITSKWIHVQDTKWGTKRKECMNDLLQIRIYGTQVVMIAYLAIAEIFPIRQCNAESRLFRFRRHSRQLHPPIICTESHSLTCQ